MELAGWRRDKRVRGIGYQDFENTIDGRSAVGAEVVFDEFSAGATFIVRFWFAGSEFDGIGGEDDIRSESTASF
jgi:hypothetical protein